MPSASIYPKGALSLKTPILTVPEDLIWSRVRNCPLPVDPVPEEATGYSLFRVRIVDHQLGVTGQVATIAGKRRGLRVRSENENSGAIRISGCVRTDGPGGNTGMQRR